MPVAYGAQITFYFAEKKTIDANIADYGSASAVDDGCKLRDIFVVASAYAKHRVGLLHKAAIDAPMPSDLLRSLREVIELCRCKRPQGLPKTSPLITCT